MKILLLERKPSTSSHTEGFLSFGDEILATIERPWVGGALGGKPFVSCVPNGIYQLRPHTRPNGDECLALVNPELGVYYLEEDRVGGIGRYLILIHVGNWVEDIVGCIAPGLSKGDSERGRMVRSSKAAMKRIMDYVGGDSAIIDIRWIS